MSDNFLSKNSFINNSFLNDSLALKSKFKVEFVFNKKIEEDLGKAMEKLNFNESTLTWNATQVSLPQYGMSLKRSDVLAQQRFVFSKREYQDLKIVFLENNSLDLKSFFQFYISLGYNEETYIRKYYPNDLTCKIIVKTLDDFGNENDYREEFIGACPYLIADTNYNISDEDTELTTTDVTFVYKKQIVYNKKIRE